MHALSRWCIARPKTTLAVAFLALVAVAPGMLRLTLRTDGHALIPRHRPQFAFDRAVRDEFGVEDPLVVIIRTDHPGGIFNPDTLCLVAELTDELARMESVRPQDVFSLATDYSHRVIPGTLTARKLLDPLPASPEACARLREDVSAVPLYRGTVVSFDESATAIMVGTPRDGDRVAFFNRVHQLIAGKHTKFDRLEIIGAPAAEALLGHHLLQDLGVPQFLLGAETLAEDVAGEDAGLIERIRQWIAARFGLVPVALAVMALVFLIAFRSPAAVALPLMEVGAAILFVFSAMGWCGVPIYLTIAVLPVILTAVGVADEIHIFSRFREKLRAHTGESGVRVIEATMQEMASPVTKTSVTTAIGFLSFALSPIEPVQAFGVLTAVGVLFCMVWSLTVVPACLALIPRRWLAPRPTSASIRDGRPSPAVRLAATISRARWAIIVLALASLTVAGLGTRSLRVQDSWIEGFAPTSSFRQSMDAFNRDFLGMHTLLIVVDAGHDKIHGALQAKHVDHHTLSIPATGIAEIVDLSDWHLALVFDDGKSAPSTQRAAALKRSTWLEDAHHAGNRIVLTLPRSAGSPVISMRSARTDTVHYTLTPRRLIRPEVIRAVDELVWHVRQHEQLAVGGALGTGDYIATTNMMAQGLQQDKRQIPDEAQRIEWLWDQYERIRGVERRGQVVDDDYARGLVSVYLKDANFRDTAKLMESVRSFEREMLAPQGMSVSFAGDVAVSQLLIDGIVQTQTRSLLISLVGVWLTASLLNGSVLIGLLAALPCALAVACNFGLMGAVGMPLGVATSMFAGMTLGIGVDFAIHFLERYRVAVRAGLDAMGGIVDAFSVAGPAIVTDGVAIALGFGALLISQVPANARLAALVVSSIGGCLLATLVLLPALLLLLRPMAPRAAGKNASAVAPPVDADS